jgi:hypothetical protein
VEAIEVRLGSTLKGFLRGFIVGDQHQFGQKLDTRSR